jgi:hypothetical protein
VPATTASTTSLSQRFDGISRLDLASGARADTYVLPPSTPEFVPSAIAVRSDGTIVHAP